MEGRREDVETSPSPFSSAVSPPREVDGLSRIWPLPGLAPKWTVRCYTFPCIDAFLHIMFSSFFESFFYGHYMFSHHVLVVQKVLVGGDGFPTF